MGVCVAARLTVGQVCYLPGVRAFDLVRAGFFTVGLLFMQYLCDRGRFGERIRPVDGTLPSPV
jgi:hypothetical protein